VKGLKVLQSIERPVDERELAGLVTEAARARWTLEVLGAGSKRKVGRPIDASGVVTTRNLRGVTLSEPSEQVISARSGTSLSILEAELAKNNQMLAAEPVDLGPMLGEPPGQLTVGGVVATNLSGARRIQRGAVRDHLLGIRCVNGRGEIVKWGGRVMKNVTGYDLCRTLAGSWGTLGIFTELTFRAIPKAEETRTLILMGLPDAIAIEVLCQALATPYEVSGTIHMQAGLARRLRSPSLAEAGTTVTALRVENFTKAVAYRIGRLKDLFVPFGDIAELDHPKSIALWDEIRQLSFLQGSTSPVWRISTAPTMGPRIVESIARYRTCHAAFDWSGGLIWLEVPNAGDAGADDIRRVVATLGGHATLIRAEPNVRRIVDVFPPLEAGVQRLTGGVKKAFDPMHIFNPGRMYAGV
jgi:glycolate oxidase FAD binding subunit